MSSIFIDTLLLFQCKLLQIVNYITPIIINYSELISSQIFKKKIHHYKLIMK